MRALNSYWWVWGLSVCVWSFEIRADQGCLSAAELVKKAVQLGNDSEEAINLYKEAQKLCPKMPETHFNIGLLYQKRNDLEESERELREALALKDDEQFRLGLAEVLLQKGEIAAAQEQYDLVLSKNSRSVPALQMEAVILEKKQKVVEATELLEKAATIEPANIVTHFNLGVLRNKLNQSEAAIASYKRAVELDPRHFDALFFLGSLQVKTRSLHDARRTFQRAAELRPDDVRVQVSLAEVYVKLGEQALAEGSLRRVVALAPSNIFGHLNLGLVLIEEHRYEEAVQVLQRAGVLDSKNARVWSAMGRAQLELGKVQEAETNLRLALSLDDSNPHTHNNLGVLLQRMGKSKEARREFEAALQLAPELEVARKNLEAAGG